MDGIGAAHFRWKSRLEACRDRRMHGYVWRRLFSFWRRASNKLQPVNTVPKLMSRIRVSFGVAGKTDKVAALLEARRAAESLTKLSGVRILGQENVRIDGRIYVDVEAASLELVKSGLPERPDTPSEAEAAPSMSDTEECLNCGNVADAPHVVCPNWAICRARMLIRLIASSRPSFPVKR